jgi:hypothetical protein
LDVPAIVLGFVTVPGVKCQEGGTRVWEKSIRAWQFIDLRQVRNVGWTLDATPRVVFVLWRIQNLAASQKERYVVAFLFEVVYRGALRGIRRAELPDAVQRQNAVHAERASVEKALLNAIIEAG